MRSTLMICAMLAGCAAPMAATPPPTPVRILDTQTYVAPYSKVWGAVVAAVSEKGLPIQAIEKDSGILTTQMVIAGQGMLEGERSLKSISTVRAGFSNIWIGARYSLSFQVTALEDSSTRVKITPHIEGFDDGLSRGWRPCPSNGYLEISFLENIRARISAR